MRKDVTNVLLGLVFIGAGVMVFGAFMDWWDFTLFIPGWWTIFIIIPCLLSIIRNGFHSGTVIGLGIGMILFLSAQDFLQIDAWQLIVPLIFVVIGLSIIFKPAVNKSFKNVSIPKSPDGIPDITACFSGNTPTFNDIPFRGCNINVIFGGVEINLRNAVITEDCVINGSVLFGGADIFLPSNVKCKISTMAVFGGVENKFLDSADANAPTVIINPTCVFGGIDIK